MPQYLGLVSVVVRNYDDAIAFYVGKLGFSLVEDTHQPAQDKRWVVEPPRISRRLQPLRRWSHEEVNEVFA